MIFRWMHGVEGSRRERGLKWDSDERGNDWIAVGKKALQMKRVQMKFCF